jgi:transcriptional regulator with XRE-family HTH domain
MENAVDKSGYGGRIKAEREKLSLTQAEFAKLGGVTSRAQRNYEAGLRIPNIRYLESLAAVEGLVDVGYILSGTATHAYDIGYAMAFRWLARALGLDSGFQEDAATVLSRFQNGSIDQPTRDAELDAILKKTRVGVLDTTLLSAILEAVEKLAPSITPRKKAGIVALLYRSFRDTGRIDEKAVIEAVDLTK